MEKRPRSDEPSKPKSKKRFYRQDCLMGNKDRVSNKNSQGDGYDFERPRCIYCGKQQFGRILMLQRRIVSMHFKLKKELIRNEVLGDSYAPSDCFDLL